MFDIGFWELIILFGLGLVILGPKRLPKVAMQVGNWAGQARRMARQLSGQIVSEINDLGLDDEIKLKDPFSPNATSRATPEYNRPGMDDLKPSAPAADDLPKEAEMPAAASSDDNTVADKSD
ncbi:MAG: Sec-independent protein translocase protein TatB [Gammaproteobacteria bacterium]|jgi:sec-independent protein translocase protein TatB|nr:twin-arginine translocase subunit TatB [Gammaproteobacteria bacterium]MDP7153728.1 Sec-independent protein translocase protein TatB [Gammaproteobacteria bacterium]MDP7296747.1 Sec-independent protein translocase protein TatB [Gammaproteobacteria bacterium]MDP7419197.1 Sec-independent protein translocase protein TatB [Gammaproteobacteria bacterium]MDP7660349.1 Sec-independent protein translocase protein TatB [Gammaproteobacteria bacterium]